MKERLKDLGIRTTELSEYMRLSRPSVYKYIDLYEKGENKQIPEKVLRTFRYIDKYKTLSKEQIVSFIIYEFSEFENSDKKEAIRNYLMNKGSNDSKVDLMYCLITTSSLDDIVQYLSNAARILDGDEIDQSELYQIARLVNLKSNLMKNIPLSEEELNNAKENLGGYDVRE